MGEGKEGGREGVGEGKEGGREGVGREEGRAGGRSKGGRGKKGKEGQFIVYVKVCWLYFFINYSLKVTYIYSEC